MLKNLFSDVKKLSIFLGVVAVLVVGIVFVVLNIVNPSTDGKSFENEYEKLNNVATEDGKKYPRVSIDKNNKIKYATYDEVLDIFENNKDAVVYFGFSKCLYCRTAIQVLVDTAAETELKEIYYLDVESKGDKYEELLTTLGDNFVNTENGGREIISPLVIFVTNGKIVSYNKGTLFSQSSPYDELDKSQIKGLSEIYSYGIRDVLTSIEEKNK